MKTFPLDNSEWLAFFEDDPLQLMASTVWIWYARVRAGAWRWLAAYFRQHQPPGELQLFAHWSMLSLGIRRSTIDKGNMDEL
jgi:hypothetical protein